MNDLSFGSDMPQVITYKENYDNVNIDGEPMKELHDFDKTRHDKHMYEIFRDKFIKKAKEMGWDV